MGTIDGVVNDKSSVDTAPSVTTAPDATSVEGKEVRGNPEIPGDSVHLGGAPDSGAPSVEEEAATSLESEADDNIPAEDSKATAQGVLTGPYECWRRDGRVQSKARAGC